MNTPRNAAIALAVSALAIACFKVPYTNRKVLNPVPDGAMMSLGASTYKSMLADVKVQKKGDDADTLVSVGERISDAANQPKYDWEYSLIDEDEINAWCLPGGKIGFYTGILPVLENEAGMAFVMGHEVGHATARHGAERLSQQVALFGGLAGLALIIDQKTKLTPEQNLAVVGALGIGLEVGVLLPFSRMHESEADIIGTMYMAEAGYPPEEAIKVWDRMSEATGGSIVPAFLSTHPTDKKRQKVITDWLPQATKRYERNKLTKDTQKPIWK